MKLVILPFGLSVSHLAIHSVRCVVMWSGARTVVVLLFTVLELYSLVHCCCGPAKAPFSSCDVFDVIDWYQKHTGSNSILN